MSNRVSIICAVVLCTAILCGHAPSLAKNTVHPDWAAWTMVQGCDLVPGDSVAYTDSVYMTVKSSGDTSRAKAIAALPGGSGYVLVHPYCAPDSVYRLLYISAGETVPFLFDAIHQPRSTTDTLSRAIYRILF